MHYVVTGGAGFIGSHIADALAGEHQVTIIDDLSTGRAENIAHYVLNPDVEVIEGSIADLSLLHLAFAGADGIFHEAAIPSVPRSVADPLTTHEAGITGTLNVLLAARDAGVRKVVYASSSSVYGDTPTLPKREDMLPTPLSPYAVTKLAGEYYMSVFAHLYGMRTVSLRYFNVFGPRQDPSSDYAAVIPKFITRLQAGLPPVIYGDGRQTRDFTYVKDVVAANLAAMASPAEGVFNIAAGRRTSLAELAALISKVVGVFVPPVHDPPRAGDVRDSLADITAAKQALGWEPAFTLEQGLAETAAWF